MAGEVVVAGKVMVAGEVVAGKDGGASCRGQGGAGSIWINALIWIHLDQKNLLRGCGMGRNQDTFNQDI